MPGGTSYYFSHGIRHLKDTRNYKLITALAPSEYKAVEDLRAKGIQVEVLPSRKTVYFENIYGENQDDRKQRVLAKADPFTVEELKDEEAAELDSTVIATDGIAVIVNNANPTDELTSDQVKAIYTGDALTWDEVVK